MRKYLQELKKHLDSRSIQKRIDKLCTEVHIPLIPFQVKEYERIDRLMTESCLSAEKKCRKVRHGNVPFSPLVDTAAKNIYLWSLLLSKLRGTKVSSSLIKRLAKKCEITIDMSLSYEEVRQLRNQAIKRYKQLKPNAKQHRERFIADLAEVMEEVYGTKRATAIRSLTVTEEQQRPN